MSLCISLNHLCNSISSNTPNLENDSSLDSQVDSQLEKIHFVDLVRDSKS